MTDARQPVPQVEAQAGDRRRVQRYRAERRFRFYGIAAIAVACGFLAWIVSDIVIKAIPAFTQAEVALDVPVTSDLADAAAPASGDYQGLVRNALREFFPNVTSRADRKALGGILSSGAGDGLRDQVIANPMLVGQTVAVDALLSSPADLYVKGIASKTESLAGRGIANFTVTGETAVMTFEAGALNEVRARLGAMGADALALDSTKPSFLVSFNGGMIKAVKVEADRLEGEILVPPATAGEAADGPWRGVVLATPEGSRKITDKEAAFVALLQEKGLVRTAFNRGFFTGGDSREPELAGILGALAGSALTMLITLGLCLPIGVGAAIYLEEFAPRNQFTHLIEVNINNLAAVPSIVFGLLGLAIFLNFGGLPRSSALVGGLVLALLVLPTIIIASRAALKSVPPSIMEAALALGATHQQAVFHHVLPLALPGIMTGTIIGMAHALGETAPLLMIGMVAFIADIPQSMSQAATVLPVQIFLWSDLPEAGFQAKTAAAILVLLLFLVVMNGLAILVRKKFERRW